MFDFIGLLICLAVGAVVGSVLTFFLHLRKGDDNSISREIIKPGPGNLSLKDGWGRIFIPVFGNRYPEQAIRTGIKMARRTGSSIQVGAFVEIPRSLSIESNQDRELEAALRVLERVEEQGFREGITISTSVAKVRSYTQGIIEAVKEAQAHLVILHQPARASLTAATLGSLADTIQAKTGCSVLILNPECVSNEERAAVFALSQG